MGSMENFDDEILLRAAYVFGILKPPVKCYTLNQIEVTHFMRVYKELTGEEIPGCQELNSNKVKQTVCQFMIDILANDVLESSLDHITGKGIADKDRRMLRDLLDIFILLIELSDIEPGSAVDDLAAGQTVPPRIRRALKEIHVGANQMVVTLSQIQKLTSSDGLQKIKDVQQTNQTRTTPKQLKTSETSPVCWSRVLSKYKEHTWSTIQQRKPLSSVHNANIKPKPVISTKCKKTSPAAVKTKQTFQNREAKKKIQSLEEELNNIKVRREEVRILMNQLQSEDKRLKLLEAILEKDIRFSRPKPKIRPKRRDSRPIFIR